MKESVRISRETTLSAVEVEGYLRRGLPSGVLVAVHDYAVVRNVDMARVVEEFFSYDPINGYELRPQLELNTPYAGLVRIMSEWNGRKPTK